jgi:Spy/CpxP family protein refolding chaperone
MDKQSLIRIAGGLGGVVIIAAGLMATVPHFDSVEAAQDQKPAQAERVRPGGRGPGGPGGRMGGGPMAGGPLREVMRDLTDAQREQVRAIQERHADRMKPLFERSHSAREALNAAVLSGNAGNLQALSIEVGNAETELSFAQAQVQSEIFSVLTAEQKQRIAERRKQMEERRGELMKRRQERTQ